MLIRLALTALLGLLQATPRSPTPTNPATATGSARYEAETVTFSHGLAFWKADNHQVRVGLFNHPPPAGILAKMRAGNWGDDGPVGTLYFELKQGAVVSPANISYCFVDVSFPQTGPMGWNANSAQSCGITSLSGDFKAGGRISAQMKGQAMGSRNKPFSWDVRFSLPIAR